MEIIEPPEKPPPENHERTRRGAVALANRLQDYWHSRGAHQVQFWVWRAPVAAQGDREAHRLYCIRSNLINGLPPPCPTTSLSR